MKLNSIFRNTWQWVARTPERSLELAYQAALEIKAIEDEHFQGQVVAANTGDHSQSVFNYFQTEVNGYLQTIRMRLQEFKASRLFINLSDSKEPVRVGNGPRSNALQPPHNIQDIIEKLNFIDATINRYQNIPAQKSIVPAPARSSELDNLSIHANKAKGRMESQLIQSTEPRRQEQAGRDRKTNQRPSDMENMSEKNSVLPRSFLYTINRIKQEIDPKSSESEEEVVRKFRESRFKTAISVKFVLILIIVPILTHQLSKIAISPMVEKYFAQQEQVVFINKDLEAEAFTELQHFEESLHFKGLIGLTPKMSSEEIEREVQDKAQALAEDYRHQGADSIENVFADLFSVLAFALVMIFNREKIAIVKSFIDDILYSLSDSAKAFLIILFTDMFVGFHSPHGWEIILEGIARHLGLPENREFNFLFIATFPVILDTVLKYWIFRYLNRISPSSVATYKTMNE